MNQISKTDKKALILVDLPNDFYHVKEIVIQSGSWGC